MEIILFEHVNITPPILAMLRSVLENTPMRSGYFVIACIPSVREFVQFVWHGEGMKPVAEAVWVADLRTMEGAREAVNRFVEVWRQAQD